jgi:hypothetical protein
MEAGVYEEEGKKERGKETYNRLEPFESKSNFCEQVKRGSFRLFPGQGYGDLGFKIWRLGRYS